MRTNIQQIIDAQPRQHSEGWYKARLGHFTGSQVGRLMKKGRGKDAEWSADAITYIKEVVAERLINPTIIEIPELFDQYLDLTIASSKVMAWGNDNEEKALGAYTSITKRKVTHCGSLPHESVECFWDSPDGIVLEDDGVLEVKCPMPKAHADYLINAKKPEDLLALKPEYYWQVIAHMAVTGATWCDWMSFCPFLKPALHIIHFERDEETIAKLIARVEQANDMASEMIEDAKKKTPAVVCHIDN
ncbi:MAG: YqaJ viral recombinase family protein [Muribaculaceae bacterium]|nr:YqaJ viral recombinase family protein [Muribaculaceae bacterium]